MSRQERHYERVSSAADVLPVKGRAELLQPVGGVCGVTQFRQSIDPFYNDLQHVGDFPQTSTRFLPGEI